MQPDGAHEVHAVGDCTDRKNLTPVAVAEGLDVGPGGDRLLDDQALGADADVVSAQMRQCPTRHR